MADRSILPGFFQSLSADQELEDLIFAVTHFGIGALLLLQK